MTGPTAAPGTTGVPVRTMDSAVGREETVLDMRTSLRKE
jgi:hypothetical protein